MLVFTAIVRAKQATIHRATWNCGTTCLGLAELPNEIACARPLKPKYNFHMESAAMHIAAFEASTSEEAPPSGLSAPLQALWWDAKGDWPRAHRLVDELETPDGMAVHAYLHRKGGEQWNADYWYRLAGRSYYRAQLAEEWVALTEGLLAHTST